MTIKTLGDEGPPITDRAGLALRRDWGLWIGGHSVPAASGETLRVLNPADGEDIGRAAAGRAPDVDGAVRAARKALPGWGSLPVARRRSLLIDVARRVAAHAEELGFLECLNNGKPLREAREDVEKSAEAFEFYAGVADKILGSTIPISPGFLNYTIREPIGVTAHISPWNYPLRLAVRSVAPALAAGNTVVLKPAEQTPLTVLRLGEILAEAGLPAGVFNVVSGLGPEAGAALAGHPDIDHLSFTGTVETGIEVMRRAAANVVPVTLELGGKSPNIVFADCDQDDALDGAIKAIFVNAGQVCCAGTRLLVEHSIYDSFVSRLIDRTRRIRVGPGLTDPDMGPLISEEQRRRVLGYIELGREEGGHILVGGGVPAAPVCRKGYFVEPTLIEVVSNTTRLAQEEIFGPVLAILRFHSDDEATRLANDSQYGLVAGIWTTNLNRAHRVAAQIQAGQVYINDFYAGVVGSPFGGYKKSGFGRERGVEALQHYTQVKSVCARLKG